MRRLIKTDGTVIDYSEPVSLAQIEGLIGATMLDIVRLRHMGEPLHVMFVDDHGYESQEVDRGTDAQGFHHSELVPTKALKPVNAEATRLYLANCVPGTTHQIVGDVFVAPDDDFE